MARPPGRRRRCLGSSWWWDLSVSSLLRALHIFLVAPLVAAEVETRKRVFQDTASHVVSLGATFCPFILVACGGGWFSL